MALFDRDYYAWRAWIDRKVKSLLKKISTLPSFIEGGTKFLREDGTFQNIDLSNKADKTIQTNTVSIPTTSWVLIEGIYEAEISNVGITAQKFVDIIPSLESIDIIKTAEVYPFTISLEGKVKVYSKNLPTNAIVVTLNIYE